MCGIAGIVSARPMEPGHRDAVVKMTNRLTHRGPDGEGFWSGRHAVLGHRRLSIIDLAGGAQPMQTEEEDVVISFNGELYNFRELRPDLEGRGERFATTSDTEVVLRAWRQWGPASLERLRGMFGFAIWDEGESALFLARDRFGIKPLYYLLEDDLTIRFSSELKALVDPSQGGMAIDHCAVQDYFAFGYVPDPKTIFSKVRRLEAGCFLEIRVRPGRRLQISSRRYWDLEFPSHKRRLSASQALDEFRGQLGDAVTGHMIADVEVGAFLSGGIDSTTVVASIVRQAGERPQTYTVGFDEREFDESSHASRVASQLGLANSRVDIELAADDALGLVSDLYTQPFADSSALPTEALCRHTADSVKVALSGDGGDEVFAGYTWYRSFRNWERLRRIVPGFLQRQPPTTTDDVEERFFDRRSRSPSRALELLRQRGAHAFARHCVMSPPYLRNLIFSEDARRSMGDYWSEDHVVALGEGREGLDPVDLGRYLDLRLYLCSDMLVKVDRASMAHSLEVRVPLLDHPLVEWAAGLETEMLIGQGRDKRLLKEGLEDWGLAQELDRPKQGFSVPINDWMRGPLRGRAEGLARSETLLDSGLFAAEGLRRFVAMQLSDRNVDCQGLWSLLVFERFLDQHA